MTVLCQESSAASRSSGQRCLAILGSWASFWSLKTLTGPLSRDKYWRNMDNYKSVKTSSSPSGPKKKKFSCLQRNYFGWEEPG